MSKMGQYNFCLQEKRDEKGVQDPNELQGEELIEYNDWLDMVNELLAEAKTKDSINETGESNESTKIRNNRV